MLRCRVVQECPTVEEYKVLSYTSFPPIGFWIRPCSNHTHVIIHETCIYVTSQSGCACQFCLSHTTRQRLAANRMPLTSAMANLLTYLCLHSWNCYSSKLIMPCISSALGALEGTVHREVIPYITDKDSLWFSNVKEKMRWLWDRDKLIDWDRFPHR